MIGTTLDDTFAPYKDSTPESWAFTYDGQSLPSWLSVTSKTISGTPAANDEEYIKFKSKFMKTLLSFD